MVSLPPAAMVSLYGSRDGAANSSRDGVSIWQQRWCLYMAVVIVRPPAVQTT